MPKLCLWEGVEVQFVTTNCVRRSMKQKDQAVKLGQEAIESLA